MNRITDYEIRHYPSNLEVLYFIPKSQKYFHQNFDLGILKCCNASIKDIQSDIFHFVNYGLVEDFKISKRKCLEIAKKIKCYI